MSGKQKEGHKLEFTISCLMMLIGFYTLIYQFTAGYYYTTIISDKSITSTTYEKEEYLKKDDPDYDPVTNTSKTVHETVYGRTVVVEIDGQEVEIRLKSKVKFLIPGQGSKIAVGKDIYGEYEWVHPIRDGIIYAIMGLLGLLLFVNTCRAVKRSKKSGKAKNKGGNKKKKKAAK